MNWTKTNLKLSVSCTLPSMDASCCLTFIVVKAVFMISSNSCMCIFLGWDATFSCCTKLCRHTMEAPPPNILPCHHPPPNLSPVFVVRWRWGKVGRPQERRIQSKSPWALRCGLPSGPGGDLGEWLRTKLQRWETTGWAAPTSQSSATAPHPEHSRPVAPGGNFPS